MHKVLQNCLSFHQGMYILYKYAFAGSRSNVYCMLPLGTDDISCFISKQEGSNHSGRAAFPKQSSTSVVYCVKTSSTKCANSQHQAMQVVDQLHQ